MTNLARCLISLLAPCMLPACLELPQFDEASRIDRPRVLAIVAEPPEARPGESVALSALIAGTERAELSWRACGALDGLFDGSGNQFGEGSDDEGCGGSLSFELGAGRTSELPGQLTRTLFQNLELAAQILGESLPRETLESIRAQVGIPFLIELTLVADGGRRLRAVKRVLLRESDAPHTNPPPPWFELGGVEIVGEPSLPFRCVTADGSVPRAMPGHRVELAPIVEGETEPWIERYQVIDSQGALQARQERAFYSWFSTGGSFDQRVSKAPLRNSVWRTPRAPDVHSLWVVVRDGHGGTSACELEVAVGDAPGQPDAGD